METLEELKAIKCKRPLGATHHYYILLGEHKISNYIDMDNCKWWDSTLCQWRNWGGVAETQIRSLSDINRIIELMEAAQGLLQVFAGVQDGYLRNELNAARKALGYKS